MKSYRTTLNTLRKLMQAMADPRLNESVERMVDADDTPFTDPQTIPPSSMSLALRQLGLIKRLPGSSSSEQETEVLHR